MRYWAFPSCCFHNEQQPKLHAAACSPSLITIALLLCLTCISDANNKNCIYCCKEKFLLHVLLPISFRFFKKKSSCCCIFHVHTALCFYCQYKTFHCYALHSLCCEYILSHYIKKIQLLCISMHVLHKKNFHDAVHSNPCAPHTKVSTLPLFYVLPSHCCAGLLACIFLIPLLHFTFQRCPFFFSALLCILHCICDKQQSKNITFFFNIAAYYISERLTKKISFATVALQYILHAISMPCRLFFSAFMADLISYLSYKKIFMKE